MKKVFIVIVILLLNNIMYAQKIKDTKVYYSYFEKPKIQLPENIKTYSVKVSYVNVRSFNNAYCNVAHGILVPTGKVNIPGANMYDYQDKDKEWQEKYLTIPNLQKVSSNADLDIELAFNQIVITKKEEDKIRNSEKKVIAWGYKYHYFTSVIFKIKTKDKTIISEKNDIKSEVTLWQNSMYIIPNSWFKEEEMLISERYVESDGFVFANNLLKQTIPQSKTAKLYLYTPKTTKKQDYSDIDKINMALEKHITFSNQNKSEKIQQVQLLIAALDTVLMSADTTNEDAKINRKLIPYLQNSKSIAYYLIQDYDKAKECWLLACKEREIAKDNDVLPFLIYNKIN